MKNVILFLLLAPLFAVSLQAQNNSLTVIGLSKGIAPIPTFGINQPAIMAFSDLKVFKNLHYVPDVAFNMQDGQLWFVDNWLKWVQPFDTTKTWSMTMGLNWAPFCQPYELANGKKPITQAVRYVVTEVAGRFQPDSSQFFTLVYWYNATLDNEYGVKGHYISLAYSKTFPLFGNRFSLTGNINPYWISFNDGANGSSASAQITLAHKRSGLLLSAQGVLPFSKKAGSKNANVALGIYREF